MATDTQFIGRAPWWTSEAGQYLLDWEQAWFDEAVADVFGFHALQLGLPRLEGLRANRMPHRWLASSALSAWPEGHDMPGPAPRGGARNLGSGPAVSCEPPRSGQLPVPAPRGGARNLGSGPAVSCEYDALPFPSQSLDLVVMPHTLEMSRDPHLALREAERVLVPEGRLMITAFNPASWWSLRGARTEDRTAHPEAGTARPAGPRPVQGTDWPLRAQMLGFRRLRDWLRLLSFEVEAARFGRFGPKVETAVWQRRWSWVEPLGQRWWPVLGAVYGLTAVKRVRGMRLVGLVKRQARYASAPRPALVSSQQRSRRSGSNGG